MISPIGYQQLIDIFGIGNLNFIEPNNLFTHANYPHISPNNTITLFINGYRYSSDIFLNGTELPNSKNFIFTSDIYNYWDGINMLFIQQLQSDINYYADAHFSVHTSNHKNIELFLKSLLSSLNVSGILMAQDADFMKYYHKENYVQLNTTPNIQGFNYRIQEGKKAGTELIHKITTINQAPTPIPLNIVCHSMGFAYALGIIQILLTQPFIQLNKFYAIAPENPSLGKVNPSWFKETWQYGSQEHGINRDKLWEQDGLAPQASMFLNNDTQHPHAGRIYIPKNYPDKGFIQSHLIKNYKWIFDLIQPHEKGYVKP